MGVKNPQAYTNVPMTPHIKKHLPLITARIEFDLEPPLPPPTITARLEFDDSHLPRFAEECEGQPEARVEEEAQEEQQDPQDVPVPQAKEEEGGSRRGTRELAKKARGPDEPTKIPKPSGEPGRPGSNGYSLETTMLEDYEWTRESWEEVNVSLRSL